MLELFPYRLSIQYGVEPIMLHIQILQAEFSSHIPEVSTDIPYIDILQYVKTTEQYRVYLKRTLNAYIDGEFRIIKRLWWKRWSLPCRHSNITTCPFCRWRTTSSWSVCMGCIFDAKITSQTACSYSGTILWTGCCKKRRMRQTTYYGADCWYDKEFLMFNSLLQMDECLDGATIEMVK